MQNNNQLFDLFVHLFPLHAFVLCGHVLQHTTVLGTHIIATYTVFYAHHEPYIHTYVHQSPEHLAIVRAG